MNPLLQFADRHPLATTLIGSGSGFSGLFLDHLPQATQIVAFVGACAGTTTAILGTLIMWRKARHNATERRRHSRDEPFEELP